MSATIPAPAAVDERVLTRRNIARIDDWIDEAGVFAKGYWESVDGRLTVTGIRIGSDYRTRVVAKFGDVIVRDPDGRFSVRPADARLVGLLAEQEHTYFDLDADSACCLPGFSCPACPPAGEVTA